MNLETFQPTQTAAIDVAHMLGDTWSRPVREAKAEPKPNDDSTRVADKNATVRDQTQKTDQTRERQLTPEMVKDASEGKLNDAARRYFTDTLKIGGIPALAKAAQELNEQLKEAGSEFRMSFVAAFNKNTGEILIAMALTKPNENHNAILKDIIKNGANSQYHERGFNIYYKPTPGEII